MHIHPTKTWMTGAVLAVAALSGCGGSTGQVTGQVKRGAEPVAGAELVFQAEEGPDQWRGLTRDDGAYRLDYGAKTGLVPGSYRVTVNVYVTADGKPLPGGEAGNALKNTGKAVRKSFQFDPRQVSAGGNQLDFDLAQGTLDKK